MSLGLPFHIHGEAWLGLISGVKTWLIYPPGYTLPEVIRKSWNPFRYSKDWFSLLLPELKTLELINSTSYPNASVGSSSYRPLKCIQRPGDILFLPAGWSHMTLNAEVLDWTMHSNNIAASAVGVGGQSVWLADARRKLCMNLLERNPNDADALKGLAISLIEMSKLAGLNSNGLVMDAISYARLVTHFASKDINISFRFFRRAISIQPYYPELRLLMIDSLSRLGASHSEECLQEIRRAETDYDMLAMDNSGNAYSAHGRATAYFRLYQALPRQVFRFIMLIRRLNLNRTLQYRDDAIRLLEKSIKLDRNNPPALVQRVMLYAERKQYDLALESLKDMEQITPGSAHIDSLRAQLQKKSAEIIDRSRSGITLEEL